MEGSKVCTKCGVEKSLEEFYRRRTSSDGMGSHCKQCDNNYKKKLSRNRKGCKVNYTGTKICSTCGKERPKKQFYRRTLAKDGLTYICKECSERMVKKWHERYRQRLRECDKKRWKRDRINLADYYVKQVISKGTGLKRNEITNEMVSLKRAKIMFHRAKQKLDNYINQNSK